MDWDIEHVRSVTEYRPGDARGRRRWLESARPFVDLPVARSLAAELRASDPKFDLEALRRDVAGLVESPAALSDEDFASVFDRVRRLCGEAEARGDDNGLSNLVLLDASTNRAYKNAVFPIKRQWIIALDREGVFLPPATRNVFLKYYSPEAAHLWLWDHVDQANYRESMIETFLELFAPLVEAP